MYLMRLRLFSFWEQSCPSSMSYDSERAPHRLLPTWVYLSLEIFLLNYNNFWQRISWLSQRWRTQQNAIRSVNCRIQWIIESLNAHCAFWYSGEHACLSTFIFSSQFIDFGYEFFLFFSEKQGLEMKAPNCDHTRLCWKRDRVRISLRHFVVQPFEDVAVFFGEVAHFHKENAEQLLDTWSQIR